MFALRMVDCKEVHTAQTATPILLKTGYQAVNTTSISNLSWFILLEESVPPQSS